MSEIAHYEILVIGSGEAGKHLTWNMAQSHQAFNGEDSERYGAFLGSLPHVPLE
jgi:hypothetical protein